LLIEGRGVAEALKVDSSKFFDSKPAALGSLEFFKSFHQRGLCYFGNVDHFSNSPSIIVHPGRDYKCSATYTGRPSSRGHPVSVHSLKYSNSVNGNSSLLVFVKFKLFSEAVYEVFRIQRSDLVVWSIESEFIDQIFIDMTQSEDVQLLRC